jgi:hypothetical protein
MTGPAPRPSGIWRPVPSALTEVDQRVEDRGRLIGRFDLEPDSFGKELEAKFEEGTAGLFPPSEVRGRKQGVVAVFESKASGPGSAGDLDDPKVHELPPFVDLSTGVVGDERAGNRDAGHVDMLMTDRSETQREPILRFQAPTPSIEIPAQLSGFSTFSRTGPL